MNYQANQNSNSRITSPRVGLTANEVSRIVQSQVKQGELVKGNSRIEYVPYQRKYIDYEMRQRVERVPVTRKIVEYQQRRVVEEIPREVVKTDYYAVQNITQYYKQVIPQKKIEMVPVEKKVRRVQYVPVEKQIVHYPENQNQDYAKGQSRVILQGQGVRIRPDAEYRRIDPKLIYSYSTQHRENPIGYVEDGYQRNLSTAPTFQQQQYYIPASHYHQFPSNQTIINQFQPINSQRQTYITQSIVQNNSSLSPRNYDFQSIQNSEVQKNSQTSTTLYPN